MVDFGRRPGDMLKSVYDTDLSDVVDEVEALPDHAEDHQATGDDEISVDGLSGELADVQPPKAHLLGSASHSADTLANLNLKVSDATLDKTTDTRTPASHDTSHQDGQADEISVAGLSGLLADEQNAGKVKGVIINDAGIGDQKVLAYDLGTERIVYITPAPSGAAINSIQQGTISITQGNTSATATITEVDVSKTFLLLNRGIRDPGDYNGTEVTIALTNATTVTATRSLNSGTTTVRFFAVEFSSGIASIQRGTISVADGQTSNDATISEVDTTKAFVNHLGLYTPETTGEYARGSIRLVNATTVRCDTAHQLSTLTAAYEVVEFE